MSEPSAASRSKMAATRQSATSLFLHETNALLGALDRLVPTCARLSTTMQSDRALSCGGYGYGGVAEYYGELTRRTQT